MVEKPGEAPERLVMQDVVHVLRLLPPPPPAAPFRRTAAVEAFHGPQKREYALQTGGQVVGAFATADDPEDLRVRLQDVAEALAATKPLAALWEGPHSVRVLTSELQWCEVGFAPPSTRVVSAGVEPFLAADMVGRSPSTRSVDVVPAGNLAVAVLVDSAVMLFRPKGPLLARLTVPDKLSSAQLSCDGSYVVTILRDKSVCCYPIKGDGETSATRFGARALARITAAAVRLHAGKAATGRTPPDGVHLSTRLLSWRTSRSLPYRVFSLVNVTATLPKPADSPAAGRRRSTADTPWKSWLVAQSWALSGEGLTLMTEATVTTGERSPPKQRPPSLRSFAEVVFVSGELGRAAGALKGRCPVVVDDRHVMVFPATPVGAPPAVCIPLTSLRVSADGEEVVAADASARDVATHVRHRFRLEWPLDTGGRRLSVSARRMPQALAVVLAVEDAGERECWVTDLTAATVRSRAVPASPRSREAVVLPRVSAHAWATHEDVVLVGLDTGELCAFDGRTGTWVRRSLPSVGACESACLPVNLREGGVLSPGAALAATRKIPVPLAVSIHPEGGLVLVVATDGRLLVLDRGLAFLGSGAAQALPKAPAAGPTAVLPLADVLPASLSRPSSTPRTVALPGGDLPALCSLDDPAREAFCVGDGSESPVAVAPEPRSRRRSSMGSMASTDAAPDTGARPSYTISWCGAGDASTRGVASTKAVVATSHGGLAFVCVGLPVGLGGGGFNTAPPNVVRHHLATNGWVNALAVMGAVSDAGHILQCATLVVNRLLAVGRRPVPSTGGAPHFDALMASSAPSPYPAPDVARHLEGAVAGPAALYLAAVALEAVTSKCQDSVYAGVRLGVQALHVRVAKACIAQRMYRGAMATGRRLGSTSVLQEVAAWASTTGDDLMAAVAARQARALAHGLDPLTADVLPPPSTAHITADADVSGPLFVEGLAVAIEALERKPVVAPPGGGALMEAVKEAADLQCHGRWQEAAAVLEGAMDACEETPHTEQLRLDAAAHVDWLRHTSQAIEDVRMPAERVVHVVEQ